MKKIAAIVSFFIFATSHGMQKNMQIIRALVANGKKAKNPLLFKNNFLPAISIYNCLHLNNKQWHPVFPIKEFSSQINSESSWLIKKNSKEATTSFNLLKIVDKSDLEKVFLAGSYIEPINGFTFIATSKKIYIYDRMGKAVDAIDCENKNNVHYFFESSANGRYVSMKPSDQNKKIIIWDTQFQRTVCSIVIYTANDSDPVLTIYFDTKKVDISKDQFHGLRIYSLVDLYFSNNQTILNISVDSSEINNEVLYGYDDEDPCVDLTLDLEHKKACLKPAKTSWGFLRNRQNACWDGMGSWWTDKYIISPKREENITFEIKSAITDEHIVSIESGFRSDSLSSDVPGGEFVINDNYFGFIVCDGVQEAKVWDLKTGALVFSRILFDKIYLLDNDILLIGHGENGILEVWDIKSNKLLEKYCENEKFTWSAWADGIVTILSKDGVLKTFTVGKKQLKQ